MERDIFIGIHTDEMIQHAPTRARLVSVTGPEISIADADLAMPELSQPALTARYVMYVSRGELRTAMPTTSRLYIATMVQRSGE
jgi:hypothetical protein